MGDLSDKVAIVTGAARGIGLGMATAFIKAGASVVLTGRTDETLNGALDQLKPISDGRTIAVRADGRDENAVRDCVRSTVDRFGRIDILVNCAQGDPERGLSPLESQTMDSFQRAFDAGVFATFLYMNHCFPHLKETHGTIINFGASAGMRGVAGLAAYGANKEAVRGLSRTAANEWGRYGITVNVIVPLIVSDERMRNDPERYGQMLKAVPLGRFGDGEINCGGLGVFLAQQEGRFMTGMTFSVDGGSYMRP